MKVPTSWNCFELCVRLCSFKFGFQTSTPSQMGDLGTELSLLQCPYPPYRCFGRLVNQHKSSRIVPGAQEPSLTLSIRRHLFMDVRCLEWLPRPARDTQEVGTAAPFATHLCSSCCLAAISWEAWSWRFYPEPVLVRTALCTKSSKTKPWRSQAYEPITNELYRKRITW